MKFNIIVLSLLLLFGFARAQYLESYKDESIAGLAVNDETTLTLPLEQLVLPKNIINGHILIRLSLGDDYAIDPNLPFSGQVDFELITARNGTPNSILPSATGSLSIDQGAPEAYQRIDLMDYLEVAGGDENLQFDELTLRISSVTLPVAPYDTRFELKLFGEVTYGVDVRGLTTTLTEVVPNDNIAVSNKVVDFKWSDSHPVSHYEIQVLRLFNYNEEKDTEYDISTVLDWSKAACYVGKADLDLANNTKSFSLAVAEGTGFYTVRIRPISTYFEEGDSRNFGAWSAHDADGTARDLSQSNAMLPYFFFTDPDDDKNWIYNRVFTEKGRVKENLTFANGLTQTIQNQTYLPSQNVTLITQTVNDF